MLRDVLTTTVRKLEVKEGDICILETDMTLPSQVKEQIRDVWPKHVKGTKVMVLEKMKLTTVLRPEKNS